MSDERLCLEKLEAVGGIFTPSLTSTAGLCRVWGLGVLALVVLTVLGDGGELDVSFYLTQRNLICPN